MSENKYRRHKQTDWATDFKHRSLNSIERRKKLERWLFLALCVVAVLMLIAVIIAYRID